MRRRSHKPRSLILFGMALIVAVGVGWFLAKRSPEGLTLAPVLPLRPMQDGERSVAHLYFGDQQGQYLTAEQRVLNRPKDPGAYARLLINKLIEGPKQGQSKTLPQTARLRAIYIAGDGVAYVDFFADAFEHHPAGIEAELITLYSIVNTLVLNIEEIRSVKLLVDGQEAATLVGHVDLKPLYKADMLWIR